MKLICKCGNIEELKSKTKAEYYVLKNNEDGTLSIICRKCGEILYIQNSL